MESQEGREPIEGIEFDLYQLVPEWTERAACIGRWKEFDDDYNVNAAFDCWSSCSVRRECLVDAMRRERAADRVEGSVLATGVRGGYTAPERLVLHKSIENHNIDLDTV